MHPGSVSWGVCIRVGVHREVKGTSIYHRVRRAWERRASTGAQKLSCLFFKPFCAGLEQKGERAHTHTHTHNTSSILFLLPTGYFTHVVEKKRQTNKRTPRNNDKTAFWCLELKTQKNVVCACVCVHSPFSFSSWSKHDSRYHSLNKKSEWGRERTSAGGRDATFLNSGPRASSHGFMWLSSAGSQQRSAAASAVTGRPLSAAWPLRPTRAIISPHASHPATPASPPGTSSRPLRIAPKLPPGGLAFFGESRKFWTNSNRPSSPSGGAEGSVTVGLRVV